MGQFSTSLSSSSFSAAFLLFTLSFFKAFDASFVHVHLQMHPIYAQLNLHCPCVFLRESPKLLCRDSSYLKSTLITRDINQIFPLADEKCLFVMQRVSNFVVSIITTKFRRDRWRLNHVFSGAPLKYEEILFRD